MTHGKAGYSGGCRCVVCIEAWNRYYRTRQRAVSRLISAHTDEFRRYWDEAFESDEPAKDGRGRPKVAS